MIARLRSWWRRDLVLPVVMGSLSIVLWLGPVRSLPPVQSPHAIPFVILMAVLLLFGFLVTDVTFARLATTSSLAEAGVVLTLLFGQPWMLLIGYVLGECVPAWYKHIPKLPLILATLSYVTLSSACAELAYRAVSGGLVTFDPRLVLGAIVGVATAGIVGNVSWLLLASSNLLKEMRNSLKFVVIQVVLMATGLGLGLSLATFWVYAPWVAVALVPVVSMSVSGQRASVRSTQRAARTEFLYQIAGLLHSTMNLEEIAEELSLRMARAFGVRATEMLVMLEPLDHGVTPEGCEVVCFGYDGGNLQATKVVRPISERERQILGQLTPESGVAKTKGRIVDGLAEYTDEHEARAAMVGLLATPGHRFGMLSLIGPLSVDRQFGGDEEGMFSTVRGEISLALERGKLDEAVKELATERDQMAQKALYDHLTGLAARPLFNDRLTHAHERWERTKRPFGVLFLDLDGFKQVNDRLGHTAGDMLLKEVAIRLLAATRKTDTAARFGGDEFAILLEEMHDPGDAELVAERILVALRRPFVLPGGEGQVRGSIGVARMDAEVEGAWSSTEVVSLADHAMYAAKRGGKDRYVLATTNR